MNGRVRIATNPGQWWLSGILLALIVAILIFFLVADYVPKAQASGTLVPEDGLVKVFSSSIGTVTKLLVDEGDVVEAGDPLMVVSFQTTPHGQRPWGDAWMEQSSQLLSSLEEDIASARSSAELERELFEKRQRQLQLEKHQLQNELDSLERRLGRAQRRVEDSQELYRESFVSEDSIVAKREEVAELETQIANTRLKITVNQTETSSLESEQAKATQEHERMVGQLQREAMTIRQQRAERQSQLVETITAPKAGKVSTLLSEAGERVYPEIPVMSLVPLWSLMQADLYVPASAIGFVRLGQEVELKFPSFPYQRYGTYSGEVNYISETTVAPGDLSGGMNFQEPVYRLTVELDKQNIVVRDGVFPMLAGMAVEMDLIGESISLFEWLMEPVQDVSERFQ